MATQQVQATIDVKSENFHQKLEESIADQGASYEQLIAANERLRANISKIFTEFVNKARVEQETNGDQKKRKIKHEDEDEEDGNDDEEDAESSDDHNEEEQ